MSGIIPIAMRDENGRMSFMKPARRDFWTEKLDARLRILAPDYSASQIATMVGATRNAVIGRCFRQGIALKRREPAVKVAPIRKAPTTFAPLATIQHKQRPHAYPDAAPSEVPSVCASLHQKREAAMVAPTADWQPARISLMDLRENTCRWPLWTGDVPFSEKFYCGLTSTVGQPYCVRCAVKAIAPRHQTEQLDSKLGIQKARAA